MLVLEEGIARGDDGSLGEVIFRYRGRQRPLERAAIPRIVRALLATEGGPDEVHEGEEDADAQDVGADSGDKVPSLPAVASVVSVRAARLTSEAEVVHRTEGEVEAKDDETRGDVSDRGVRHAAEDLREPEVEASHQAEEHAAKEHVVEVRDDEVAVLLLGVGGSRGVHDAGETAAHEHPDEAEGEDHRRGEADASAPDRAEPVEDFDARRDGDGHREEREGSGRHGAEAGGEHVVTPDGEAEEADDGAGEDDDRVAEERLAGEGRQDFRDDAHRGEHEDVHFRVAEDPEEVLPQDGLAAGGGVEEVGAEGAVEHELDQRDGDGREGEDDEDRGDERHPGEHRQAHHGHALGAHIDDGADEVEGGRERGDAEDLDADDPEVGADAGEAQGLAILAEGAGKRCVAEPTVGGSEVGVDERLVPFEGIEPAGEVRELEEPRGVQHEGAEDEGPERERVEAREGDVARADLQRHEEVEERGRQGHDAEEDHRRAVHGEQLVVHTRRDEVVVRAGQLGADREGFDAAHEEVEHGEGSVQDADLLVVDGRQPVDQAGRAVGTDQAEVAALGRQLGLAGDRSVMGIVGHGCENGRRFTSG